MSNRKQHSLDVSVYPELGVCVAAVGGAKLSRGNWKGSETGTRPPNIPKPRGTDDTCIETDRCTQTCHRSCRMSRYPEEINSLHVISFCT